MCVLSRKSCISDIEMKKKKELPGGNLYKMSAEYSLKYIWDISILDKEN